MSFESIELTESTDDTELHRDMAAYEDVSHEFVQSKFFDNLGTVE
jgi:hypothetical protein